MANYNVVDILISTSRIVFGAALLIILDALTGIGTNIYLLTSVLIAGTLFAPKVARFKYTTSKILLALTATLLANYLIFSLLNFLPFSPSSNFHLKLAAFEDHFLLIHIIFLTSSIGGFLFWRYKNVATLEIMALSLFFIALFASHRNYRFDLMQVISDLAWYLETDQLSTLIILAVILFINLCLYLYLATHPKRSVLDSEIAKTNLLTEKKLTKYRLQTALFSLMLLGLATLVWYKIYNFHDQALNTRLKNGVGDSHKEGVSPLNFHSSLGGSSAAVAIVRLEGDYPENPQTPLLYFREAALSAINENQLVAAPPRFNPDVSATSPKTYFKQQQDFSYDYRMPLKQSIFLLSKHNLAFAIDYPLSIIELSLNSAQERFISAYRAYSMVPTFSFNNLQKIEFGDPKWTNDTKEHFLRRHPDQRYHEKALEITKDQQGTYDKIKAITTYLSKNSIYTLKPAHEVPAGADPVAPYLFGDLRGYCVHFAHAITYMLRSIDIPARVATGYMTDLSQSKDGHILLRMNDRHAWPEAFVQNIGWIPFDIQPEQVESHAETPVDADMLEELIGLIDPGEEILPKDIGKDEISLQTDKPLIDIKANQLVRIFLVLYCLVILLNFITINAWYLVSNKKLKLRLYFKNLLYQLKIIGYPRMLGETFIDYHQRLSKSQLNQLREIHILEQMYFRNDFNLNLDAKNLNFRLFKGLKFNSKLEQLTFLLKKLWLYFNPLTAMNILLKRF